MTRKPGSKNVWIVTALATAAVLSLAGCPGGLFGFVVPFTVTVTNSGEPTVDKTITVSATVSGGIGPFTFSWSQTEGPAATITNGSTANASVVPLAAGFHTFRATVTDTGTGGVSTADVRIPIGNIQFIVAVADTGSPTIPGNPATIRVTDRTSIVTPNMRVSVFDPEFTADDVTTMTVRYDVVSWPAAARMEDVSLDRTFDSISNQGTGDSDASTSSFPSLDGVVRGSIRANPDTDFKTITNLGTSVDNYGIIVPGSYVFRATVTNPNGLQRTRDLTINLALQGITAIGFGGDADGGDAVTSGPGVVRVRELPAPTASKHVTNVVMLPSQSSSLTVSVFPSTPTTYRFFLRDNAGANDGGARPGFVTPSQITLNPTGDVQTIALTIGGAGLTPASYRVWWESFDNLSQFNSDFLKVNRSNTPLLFHVTSDWYAQTAINAARVGVASNDPDFNVPYQGWSSQDNGTFTGLTALVDADLDGVLDVISSDGGGNLRINWSGFTEGSVEAWRHPVNAAFLDGDIGDTTNFLFQTAGFNPASIAVGDLNGDGLPDFAASNGNNRVQVFFHTGNPAQPYSAADDHTLNIFTPSYDYSYFNSQTKEVTINATPFGLAVGPTLPNAAANFGAQIAIANVGGDASPDLIVTVPGYSTIQAYNFQNAGALTPPTIDSFFLGSEGRVFVFFGGSANLSPARPDFTTVRVTQQGIYDPTAIAGARASVSAITETDAKYNLAFHGNLLDFIGNTLAAAGGSFAVGSAAAINVQGSPVFWYQFPPTTAGGAEYTIADQDAVTINLAGQTRIYEFDTNGALFNAGAVAVDISNPGDSSPSAAIIRLKDVMNADANRLTNALSIDASIAPNAIAFVPLPAFSVLDFTARTSGFYNGTYLVQLSGGGGIVNSRQIRLDGTVDTTFPNVFEVARDGVVYRQGAGVLAGQTRGTLNSNMGFGAALAKGSINAAGVGDDLVVGALDSGEANGRNDGLPFNLGDDGAVFVLLDGATTLTTKATPGANTLRIPADANVPPTAVGRHVAIAPTGDVLYTEPGFGRIYLHKSAAFSTSPSITFVGVVFGQSGASPSIEIGNGSFLFGDITGDGLSDWVFFDDALAFGFAGVR